MKASVLPAAALAALLSVVSCKKDDEPKPTTTLSKIQSKWMVKSKVMHKSTLGSAVRDSTYTGVTADYMEFRINKKMYRQINNMRDTLIYSVPNDTTLILDNVSLKISKLSSNECILKQTLTMSVGSRKDTTIVTFNLKK